jgi:putative two-component system response regulator
MQRHPVLSERICRPLTTLQSILPLIRYHHERYDGSGYPEGLSGDAIPLGARILGMADAFDALTSVRPYRPTFTVREALQVLSEETRAGRWDPQLFAALAAELGDP